jgi:hypothetical protein
MNSDDWKYLIPKWAAQSVQLSICDQSYTPGVLSIYDQFETTHFPNAPTTMGARIGVPQGAGFDRLVSLTARCIPKKLAGTTTATLAGFTVSVRL